MEQEGVSDFTHYLIQSLCITGSTQSCCYQRLSFTTGEQRRTVSTRQNTGADIQCTNHVFFTAVDTRLAVQYTGTDN